MTLRKYCIDISLNSYVFLSEKVLSVICATRVIRSYVPYLWGIYIQFGVMINTLKRLSLPYRRTKTDSSVIPKRRSCEPVSAPACSREPVSAPACKWLYTELNVYSPYFWYFCDISGSDLWVIHPQKMSIRSGALWLVLNGFIHSHVSFYCCSISWLW